MSLLDEALQNPLSLGMYICEPVKPDLSPIRMNSSRTKQFMARIVSATHNSFQNDTWLLHFTHNPGCFIYYFGYTTPNSSKLTAVGRHFLLIETQPAVLSIPIQSLFDFFL